MVTGKEPTRQKLLKADKMDISKDIIEKYAKKIYGFAFSKTREYNDAQDLSQEILIALFDKTTKLSQIENMDAYIYRICCYTWMNFYRKDIQKRKNLENASMLEFVADETDIEEEYIKKELHEKLRQEIMYLSKMKREVTIMFYYENKTSKEISEILNISDSSVRWYLGESKKALKERIEMTEQTGIYKPIRLCVGHNGWTTDFSMCGLTTDVLMQNICYVCYHQPCTVEEIARTLGVAAVYLEDKINKLLYMDYLKIVGKNKYQTTFFITEEKFNYEAKKFMYNNLESLALPIYNYTKDFMEALKNSGTLVGDFNDNFLVWALLTRTILNAHGYIIELVSNKMGLNSAYPKRKDGSEHYVSASMENLFRAFENEKDEGLKNYELKCFGNGVKICNTDKVGSLQFDISFFGQGWRNFEEKELKQLYRICQIIENNEKPNDYDKDAIANLVQKGYIKVENEKPIILIPYIKPKDNSPLEKYYDAPNFKSKLAEYLNVDEIVDVYCKQVEQIRNLVPKFLDINETNQAIKDSLSSHYGILWYLYQNNYLTKPTDDEVKRLCTLIHEK